VNVLVTGATGFIGSQLVPRLLTRGDNVRVLVRTGTDASGLGAGVEVVRGDLADAPAVERAVEGCQVVYHLAKAPGGSSKKALEQVNVIGTTHVARAASRASIDRLVHCSSTAVYGHQPNKGLPLSEDAAIRPDSPYARSKALAEQAVWSYAERLPVVVARITSVLGPRARGWLSLFRSVRSGRFRLIGGGNGYHHPADVSDVVEGLVLCADSQLAQGRTYVLGGPESIPLHTMVQLIREELNVDGPSPRSLPASVFRCYLRLNQLAELVAGIRLPRTDSIAFLLSDRMLDISRARRELGYAPQVGIRQAIHRTAQWYNAEGFLPAKASKDPGAPEHAAW
jgi:nucleoside-diphosphate-sugar epimerase